MEKLKTYGIIKLPVCLVALCIIAGLLSTVAPLASSAGEPVVLTVKGDGVNKVVNFTMADLRALPQKTYTYSGYNHWPSLKVFKNLTGPTLKSILDVAGLKDNATLFTLRPSGGGFVRMDYTRAQLLEEPRYYFPDGESPGDCVEWPPKRSEKGKIPVETIIAMNDSDGRICFGQRKPNEPTIGDCVMIQQMLAGGTIEVSTEPLEHWEAPSVDTNPGTVAPGTKVTLKRPDDIPENIMVYYTLDGSDPTYGSNIFNISYPQFRPEEMNKPIPINGTVTVKARTIGFGKLDSEVKTFQYNTGVSAPADGTGKNTVNKAEDMISDFIDLQNHWAKEDINTLVEKGVIDGTETEFKPDEKTTRAQFAQWLVKALHIEVNQGEDLSFKDVPASAWYHDYVAAAVKAGLIKGNDDNTYAPNECITREQISVIITRALKMKSTKDLSHAITQQATDKFADKDAISPWARQDIALAVSCGIVSGVSEDRFAPQLLTTRAEAAVMILRLYNLLQ
ncbi:S-layer domain protein [Desulfofarcimen acetoxidans DSM 771]|uniref:S-layer domain protein n=1 Tax=Desulfofarcimen acetoxidans (strain ATCC 49208 / DSM 771 / KCTC 5769 / VKM B-1644 / 5575) TaxID=485916 RepID=C8W6U9_DESAS|nr:S-layer homology domain-containing protein [Desulfofarcimen acetoxidans]ACV64208.1 S-layer domain protein [Desulfofarcimen acetoxidans DSM 771]